MKKFAKFAFYTLVVVALVGTIVTTNDSIDPPPSGSITLIQNV